MTLNTNIIPLNQPDAKPRVSVILVSFMTGPALFECVASVLADRDIYELIIVDNGNPEAARTRLSEIISQDVPHHIKLIQGHGNIGFSRGCNYGARMATGDYFLFLNPDAVISPGAALKLAQTGQSLDTPWIAGGLIRNIDGSEQRGSRRDRLTLGSAFVTFTGLYKLPMFRSLHLENQPLPTEPVAMEVLSGAFMMTDRASFDSLGGFDESYFLHVEDIDICEQTRRLGGQVYFVPSATAKHYGSTSDTTRQMVEREKLKGFLHYFWKFADNPLQKVMVLMAAPLMVFAIKGRAWYLALRKGVTGR